MRDPFHCWPFVCNPIPSNTQIRFARNFIPHLPHTHTLLLSLRAIHIFTSKSTHTHIYAEISITLDLFSKFYNESVRTYTVYLCALHPHLYLKCLMCLNIVVAKTSSLTREENREREREREQHQKRYTLSMCCTYYFSNVFPEFKQHLHSFRQWANGKCEKSSIISSNNNYNNKTKGNDIAKNISIPSINSLAFVWRNKIEWHEYGQMSTYGASIPRPCSHMLSHYFRITTKCPVINYKTFGIANRRVCARARVRSFSRSLFCLSEYTQAISALVPCVCVWWVGVFREKAAYIYLLKS